MVCKIINKIRSLTKFSRTLIAFYRSLVELYVDYKCRLVWGNCRNSKIEQHALLKKRTIQYDRVMF